MINAHVRTSSPTPLISRIVYERSLTECNCSDAEIFTGEQVQNMNNKETRLTSIKTCVYHSTK